MSDSRKRQRQDPYIGKAGRGRRVLQMLLLFIVVAALSAAALLLYSNWLQGRYSDRMRLEPGNTALNPAEYFYLQTYLLTQADQLAQPAGGTGFPTAFVVSQGESARVIASNLAAQGLLKDPELFVNYARYYGLDGALEAGNYTIEPSLTIPELATLLTRAVGTEVTLVFLEGWRAEEMANYLASIRPARVDPEMFIEIVKRRAAFDLSQYAFLAGLPADASLEGYLFPDTYRLDVEADAAVLVDLMLETFAQRVTPAMRQAYGVQGLTLYEALTLASIVEREAVLDEERPIIAGVFLNRLTQGIQLAADPTIQYALGRQSDGNWWKSPLSAVDLQLDSPYNTYLTFGLPPSPIANPGLASLQSVAEPAATDYVYFVASCAPGAAGAHVFSVTYEEHLANVQRCR